MGNTKYIFIRESYLEYMDVGWHVICGRERLHCIFLKWDFVCVWHTESCEYKDHDIQISGADDGGISGHHCVLFLVFLLSLHTRG